MTDPSVFVVILAAGMARRMGHGGAHKLLARFDGVALIRRTALAAKASSADGVIVVTGHRCDAIEAALEGLPLDLVHNPDYTLGMAGSLNRGLDAAEMSGAEGALVALADMPEVTARHMDALVGAFRRAEGRVIVRATDSGRPGNPVLLPKAVFAAVRTLSGDIGARRIIAESGLDIIDVEIGRAASLDLDTPEAVRAAGGIMDA